MVAEDQVVARWLVAQGAQHDFSAWAELFGADVSALWQACPRGDWLLALAARLHAPPSALVLAACGCAETTLDLLAPDQTVLPDALRTIRVWAQGHGEPPSLAQLEAVRGSLEGARDGATDPVSAEAALAALAALETLGDPSFAASAAAFATQAAMASAADCAMMESLRFAQHQTAECVRAALPAAAIVALWSARKR